MQRSAFAFALSLSAEWSLPAVFMIYQPSWLCVSAISFLPGCEKPRKLRLLPHPADEMCPGRRLVCTRGGGSGSLLVCFPTNQATLLMRFAFNSLSAPLAHTGRPSLCLRGNWFQFARLASERARDLHFAGDESEKTCLRFHKARRVSSRKRRNNWRSARKSVSPQRILTEMCLFPVIRPCCSSSCSIYGCSGLYFKQTRKFYQHATFIAIFY